MKFHVHAHRLGARFGTCQLDTDSVEEVSTKVKELLEDSGVAEVTIIKERP